MHHLAQYDDAYLARSNASVWVAANDNTDENPEARTAGYRAAMAEWHARDARAKAAAARYYAGGAKVSIDGTPCRVAFEPTKHMLALMRLTSGGSSKALRDMADTRYPQTTYATAAAAEG